MTTHGSRIGTALGLITSVSALVALTFQFEPSSLAGDYAAQTWFPLVNLNHNAFHSWRLDHLTRFIASLRPHFNVVERPIVGLLILLLGTYIFVRRSDGEAPQARSLAVLASTFASIFLVLITGLDPVAIGSVAWLPLMALALHTAMTSRHPALPLLLLTAISLESACSSNQAAILSAATAVWLAYLLALSRARGPVWAAAACALAFTPAIVVTVVTPMAELPPYPKSAHVLPFDDTFQTLRPLLGPAYPFDTVDRPAVRSLYAGQSLVLFLLTIFSWWVRRRHQTAIARYCGKVGLVLATLAVLNTCFPEPFATISPLPSLARMLPWGTSYSITSVVLALSAWMTVTSLVLNTRTYSIVPLACSTLALFLVGSPYIRHPILRTSGLATDATQRALILSPSAAIFRELLESHIDIPQKMQSIRDGAHIPAKDARDLKVTVDMHSASAPLLATPTPPAESSWRWSTRTGTQRGDEVLTIRLAAPLEVHGIELDPGPYVSDYPRGLRITGGTCDKASADILADYPVWQGSLKVLSRGIPYYSPRNEVRVVFSSPKTVSCMFAQQTGRANFDWSVSRVKVLVR